MHSIFPFVRFVIRKFDLICIPIAIGTHPPLFQHRHEFPVNEKQQRRQQPAKDATADHVEREVFAHVDAAPAHDQRPHEQQRPRPAPPHGADTGLYTGKQPQKRSQRKRIRGVTGNETVWAAFAGGCAYLRFQRGIVAGAEAADVVLEKIGRLIAGDHKNGNGQRDHDDLLAETAPEQKQQQHVQRDPEPARGDDGHHGVEETVPPVVDGEEKIVIDFVQKFQHEGKNTKINHEARRSGKAISAPIYSAENDLISLCSMNRAAFDEFVNKSPDRRFCLHNGFAGFSYGSPSNPKWLDNNRAFKILSRYEKLTGVDPILNFNELWEIQCLLFTKKAWVLRILTGKRMMGFNRNDECSRGMDGLG